MFYGSVALFKTYHQARGRVIPVGWSDVNIESALLVSSEWLDGQYESIWIGYKTNGYTQEQSWPRTNAQVQAYPYYLYSTTTIPDKVVNATYEVAFKYLTDPTVLNKDFVPQKYKSVSVSGAISVEYNSLLMSTSDIQTSFYVVQDMISGLIDNNAAGSYSPISGSLGRA